jgi:hypothetical protein
MANRLRRALTLLLILSACQAPTNRLDSTRWGPLLLLAEAEQADAPAIQVQPDGSLTAAWIGTDAAGVHQDARTLRRDNLSPVVVLPLPPRRPTAQALVPASGGSSHLIWLDADERGVSQVYTALLTPELRVERGPIAISDSPALRFVALPAPGGQALIFWSGGPPAEPMLTVQRIDRSGLPAAPQRLAYNADWPTAALANDGIYHIAWLDSNQRVGYGQLRADSFSLQTSPVHALERRAGDRLHQFQAALDTSHLYLFWNLTRLDEGDQTWMISRDLQANTWSQPQRLGISLQDGLFTDTGFNTGTVQAAAYGERWLRWTAPLAGQFETLAAAGAIDHEIGGVYLRAGAIVGYQSIQSVDLLIGQPTLQTDQDRHLYLAWAEPGSTGLARLYLTSTRPHLAGRNTAR